MSSRIADSRLAFYENNIAAAIGILRRINVLAEIENDPNKLRSLREAAEYAAKIRERNICEMRREKNG